MKKKVLVTGSGGLVGSQAVDFFAKRGFVVFGIDNDMRAQFFGATASTRANAQLLHKTHPSYRHFSFDIRNARKVEELFSKHHFDLIIHTAAQPSHDWAANDPKTDFSINATATLSLLEAYRRHCPKGVFLFTSTNKVYGDRPNLLPLIEKKTRFELRSNNPHYRGIDESMSIDTSLHSLFGASKVSADILVQEYGRYFGLRTGIFRCGCITGPAHAGAPQHGFLAYLVRAIANGTPYTIHGYKGKQVRDNIHAYDLVQAFWQFYRRPRVGEVYNMGGGRFSNISILEAIPIIESRLGKKAKITYNATPRRGDHIWYISNVKKFRSHYPFWKQTYDTNRILDELCSLATPA